MKALDFFFATRPLLQIPIWTVYLVALHYHLRLSGESFALVDLLIMVCISLVFSAAAYLNQVYDYESDRINGKVGFLQRGYITRSALLKGATVLVIVPLAVVSLVSFFTLFLFTQFVFFAWAYSVPKWRMKDRPAAGLFANAWGHGLLVSFAVMPDIASCNSGLLSWNDPFYFFLAVGSTYILTTIPDRSGDEATGKRTLAVVLGRTGALLIALVLVFGSAGVAAESGHLMLVILSLLSGLLVIFALIWRSDRPVLFAAKAPLLLLTLLAGFSFPWYLLFVVALVLGCRIYYRKRFNLVYPELA